MLTRVRAVAVTAAVLALAGCGLVPGTGAPAQQAPKQRAAKQPVAAVQVGRTTGSTVAGHVWPGPHQPPAGFEWLPVAGSPYLAVATTDGGAVSLLWMDAAHLGFRYVPGSKYPEGSPRTAADVNPATWTAKMLAVFNGGFKLHDHVGGYYYQGVQVAPLLPGYAAVVLYRDGTMRLGEWGRDLHMSPDVLMVRENLRPFVDHGQAQTSPSDTYRTWGFTFNHRWYVNRSAIGALGDGTLVYVWGHNVRPSTMADTLVAAGSRFAVYLDMNGYFPAAYTYEHVGNRVLGTRLNPYVIHPPNLYYHGYIKDFFVLESR